MPLKIVEDNFYCGNTQVQFWKKDGGSSSSVVLVVTLIQKWKVGDQAQFQLNNPVFFSSSFQCGNINNWWVELR